MTLTVRARVPSSSANLGPGFDSLAAALSLSLELEVAKTGQFSISSDVEGMPHDRSNLCVRAFEKLAPVDDLSFQIRSQIPVSAGLGSSAAAIVAGLVCANRMYELRASLAEPAVALEGHPDNVFAALYGGFVVCTNDRAERIDPPPRLEGVVVIPPERVATSDARRALASDIPLTDAVHNTAHTALLVLGLCRGDLDLVARGLADRIHQPRREPLYRRSMELVRRAVDVGALGATISGAGPAVLYWTRRGVSEPLCELLRAQAPDCTVAPVAFIGQGAQVTAFTAP